MKVTEQDVARVAGLANLELTPEERVRLSRDLNAILDYMDRLNQLDTSDVPPMAQVSEQFGPDDSGQASLVSAYRQDIIEGLRPSLPRQESMRNAPDTDGTFFKVPKVIER